MLYNLIEDRGVLNTRRQELSFYLGQCQSMYFVCKGVLHNLNSVEPSIEGSKSVWLCWDWDPSQSRKEKRDCDDLTLPDLTLPKDLYPLSAGLGWLWWCQHWTIPRSRSVAAYHLREGTGFVYFCSFILVRIYKWSSQHTFAPPNTASQGDLWPGRAKETRCVADSKFYIQHDK